MLESPASKTFAVMLAILFIGGALGWQYIYKPYGAESTLRARHNHLMRQAREAQKIIPWSPGIPRVVPAGYYLNEVASPETSPGEKDFRLVYADGDGSQLLVTESDASRPSVIAEYRSLAANDAFRDEPIGQAFFYYASRDPRGYRGARIAVYLNNSVLITVRHIPAPGGDPLPEKEFLAVLNSF